MKVAIVIPNDFGIEQFCKVLVELLRNGGKNEIYAICDVHLDNSQTQHTNALASLGVVHVPVKYFRFFSITQDLLYLLALFGIFRRERFDMVVTIATKPNIYGSVVAKIAGVKKVACSVWGLGVTFADDGGLKRKLFQKLVLFLYWIAFRLSDKVWFTNEFDFNWFISMGIVKPPKVFLTKNYVNTDEYFPDCVNAVQKASLRQELGLTQEDRVVVMVARMSWAKGVREFAEAAAILRDKRPAIKFILIGPLDDGSPDSVPESYLREHAGHANFTWTGFRKDVHVFYAISDVVVLPTYYREGGFPRGLTEAMAMGKPIIASNSVHCRGTVDEGKNGYLVPIRDSEALANAIVKIVEGNCREAFGQHSRLKALDEFDERKIVTGVVKEFLQINPL